tara:strand:+ start:668 stop:1381 length:714 start_codon:yes stop_codon:yes gene_type:complete
MGYLNHSTNNIILDAVLTDRGRQFLARNDGSFNIVKFALSDDDVDYTIIEKFGRTVGKEKIEKNTPIMEGMTNQNYAQKYKLVSVSNAYLTRLPTVSLTGEGVNTTGTTLSMGRLRTTKRTITLSQTIEDEQSINVELRDQVFIVEVNNSFLQLSSTTPDSLDATNMASYLVTRDPAETGLGGTQLTMTLELKNITDNQFTVYGNASDKTTISTQVKITGLQSGAVKEFTINISKTS